MVEITRRLFRYTAEKMSDGIDLTIATAILPITLSHASLNLLRAVRETRQITNTERKEINQALLELRILLESGHPKIVVRAINQHSAEYTIELSDLETLKIYYVKQAGEEYQVQFDVITKNEFGKPLPRHSDRYHLHQRCQSKAVFLKTLRQTDVREHEQLALQELQNVLEFLREFVRTDPE